MGAKGRGVGLGPSRLGWRLDLMVPRAFPSLDGSLRSAARALPLAVRPEEFGRETLLK